MQDNIKLQKQLLEVKYLAQENSYRYRPIMRFFYNKYEQAQYWLYKEDVYEFIKEIIEDYTIEECERDLEFLVSNLSLTKLQDTKNINTISEFKIHNFRYQMSDYAVSIERMTIELEEMEVKVSSLEPRLFERIENKINKIINIYNLDENEIYEIWIDLTTDFKNLNEQYQDFLKKFHEAKTEELLQSEAFLEFKSSMINYITDFIKSYIVKASSIKNSLLKIDDDKLNYLMNSLVNHQRKAPKISPDFDYDKLKQVNLGKWQSLVKWFVPLNDKSEGDRLLEATQNIIEKIYKYASALIELHGNMINRKEEYKHICRLFDKQTNLKSAKELSASIFGIIEVKHYKGRSLANTDSLIKSYEIDPIEIPINTTVREYKLKTPTTPIIDKTNEKIEILNKIKEKEENRKKLIKNLIKKGTIELNKEVKLSSLERKYILKLITKKQGKETEFGYIYNIENIEGKCTIISEDGKFLMNSKIINIEVGDINA